ncbi:MAG: TetR/AcrR family transcriptional regulator [Alphaproteobacteria bacterium]
MTSTATAGKRQEALRAFKRAAILDAAKRVFAEKGLEGASVRLIAAEAGYTPGAIYYHYPDKEHVYGDILMDSLGALGRAVKHAAAGAANPEARLRAAARAFFAYYRDHPEEFDLSFYLERGIEPRGLTPEFNRQLNGRLIAILRVIADALGALGRIGVNEANTETVSLVGQLCGVLLMDRSGRLKTLGFAPAGLVDRYLDQLVARLA